MKPAWDSDELAVASDGARMARFRRHQSWYREHVLRVPPGEYPDRNGRIRPLGNLLREEAVEHRRSLNFLDEDICDLRPRTCTSGRERGRNARGDPAVPQHAVEHAAVLQPVRRAALQGGPRSGDRAPSVRPRGDCGRDGRVRVDTAPAGVVDRRSHGVRYCNGDDPGAAVIGTSSPSRRSTPSRSAERATAHGRTTPAGTGRFTMRRVGSTRTHMGH